MTYRIMAAALGILFGYCAYWPGRIAYSEWLSQDQSLAPTQAALRLTPDNPFLYIQLARALLAAQSIDAVSVRQAIHTALSLNPASSALWLESADISEQLHDYSEAESHFVRAVQIDRTFAPRWLLAEYYGRRSDEQNFWPAMRAALKASYDDVTPLFDTCWSMTERPETILRLAIPARQDVMQQYLDYLISKDRLDLAEPVAMRLLPSVNAFNAPSLLSFCDRLLWRDQARPAMLVWNALAEKKLISYPVIHPRDGISLTNGAFDHSFMEQGFDWRLQQAAGVTVAHDDAAPSLRLEFSGRQSEHQDLASQFVDLAPSRTYLLEVSYESGASDSVITAGKAAAADTGVRLRMIDLRGEGDLLESEPSLPESLGQRQERIYRFHVPPEGSLYRLVISYDRPVGTTKFEGSVIIHTVHLGFGA